jgi:hypothetical protein
MTTITSVGRLTNIMINPSACETIFEVSPTSVLLLLGSCQSRLQREWA